MKHTIALAAVAALFFTSCAQPDKAGEIGTAEQEGAYAGYLEYFRTNLGPDTPKEAEMRAAGLVDIHDVDSTIAVQLVYTGPYNFMGHILYHGFTKAMMRPELAEKVAAANRELKSIRPTANLIIYDAARPISIQKEMWDSVVGTDNEDYVANPYKGNGLHNYGAAVDVSMIDATGTIFQMGSEYDFFGAEARTEDEETLVKTGRISVREYENRLLLRKVMTDNGLLSIKSEWWHFNLMPASEAKEKLTVIQ